MAYEPKNGDITIFRNEDKKEGSNQPDYTGKYTDLVTGEQRRVALWIKEAKSSGKKFMSGSVSVPQQKQDSAPAAPAPAADPDLPF